MNLLQIPIASIVITDLKLTANIKDPVACFAEVPETNYAFGSPNLYLRQAKNIS